MDHNVRMNYAIDAVEQHEQQAGKNLLSVKLWHELFFSTAMAANEGACDQQS